MPATFIGLPTSSGANAKILRNSEYQREMNGLETITEIYTVRSANKISLQPDRNTLHSAFSTDTIKHGRMQVENVSFRELPGELAEMSVSYVGLTGSSGLPAPIIRLIPVPTAGATYIEIEYVTDQTEENLINTSNTTRMPPQINGYPTPPNPEPYYIINSSNGFIQPLGYCYDSTESTRRGSMLVVRATFRKKTKAAGLYVGSLDV